jgi:NTE family protein
MHMPTMATFQRKRRATFLSLALTPFLPALFPWQVVAAQQEEGQTSRLPAFGTDSTTRSSPASPPLPPTPLPPTPLPPTPLRLGLALGSGGARGLAHVLVLEVLDRLGLRPHRIAGSSIGAILGALYAAGVSAAEIHDLIDSLTKGRDESWWDALVSRELTRWLRFVEPGLARGGLARSDAFIEFLREQSGVSCFADLSIPLRVVATDFWERESIVLEQGDLWQAVQASMAVPGLFLPVMLDGRLLVDGGLTNPLPFDLLEDCNFIIAVDVLGKRTPNGEEFPSSLDSLFNTFQIMQSAILTEKIRRHPPDILVRPDIHNVRVLEFFQVDTILDQGRAAAAALEEELRRQWPGGNLPERTDPGNAAAASS